MLVACVHRKHHNGTTWKFNVGNPGANLVLRRGIVLAAMVESKRIAMFEGTCPIQGIQPSATCGSQGVRWSVAHSAVPVNANQCHRSIRTENILPWVSCRVLLHVVAVPFCCVNVNISQHTCTRTHMCILYTVYIYICVCVSLLFYTCQDVDTQAFPRSYIRDHLFWVLLKLTCYDTLKQTRGSTSTRVPDLWKFVLIDWLFTCDIHILGCDIIFSKMTWVE